MENLSVEELADKMGALNYEKLIKALFLFEKTLQWKNSPQIKSELF